MFYPTFFLNLDFGAPVGTTLSTGSLGIDIDNACNVSHYIKCYMRGYIRKVNNIGNDHIIRDYIRHVRNLGHYTKDYIRHLGP